MRSVAEALEIVLGAAAPLGAETVPLAEARGRFLAEPVAADRDAPPSDRSAMDGFAVRAKDAAAGAVLRIGGELPAGRSADGVRVLAGTAIRIFTGAVVPEGADAVVMVEATDEDRGTGRLTVREAAVPGQHIRRRGEDARAASPVLEEGRNLGPAEIAALASVGRATVRVGKRPSAVVLSTGDEIVGIADAPAPHQIRNSNAPMLTALLRDEGAAAEERGNVADDPEALAAAIEAAGASDLVLLSGGVSVGDYDLVEDAVRRCGYDVLFHNVAMRPGKPLLAARRERRLLFGLPGNPLSAFAGFRVFVLPAVRRLMGDPAPRPARRRAVLAEALRQRPGREGYVLARLTWPDGEPVAVPVRSASSGDVLSLARANAFVVVPAGTSSLDAGARVDVMAWGARAPGEA
ncbi:MAG TPA: gephyrin-like molybdotransferase Glp [Candidatus Polarisedimenticolaceae bacterium]|nr:gephyrin-like molybdotransferase Glp [Candidatus Polarisedimenticolaceae bacterium]